MPRQANYNTTVDDCLTVSITKLKEWNYLTNGSRNGKISWSRNGNKHSTISIEVSFLDYDKHIILDYKINGVPKRYKVKIIEVASNLGKGCLYYFLCPITLKLCRKLYLHCGMFLHRTAFNMMYEKQIESKKYRDLTKVFEKAFISDSVYEERYQKYFKTHYNGKPTKRYLKLENKIRIAESYPANIVEQLLMR